MLNIKISTLVTVALIACAGVQAQGKRALLGHREHG